MARDDRPSPDSPLVLSADLRIMLLTAVDSGDYALARRCLDVMERMMGGDRAAVKEAKQITKEGK